MKKILLLLIPAIFAVSCSAGMNIAQPDPKRIACEQSCSAARDKAVDKCKKEKKPEDVCKAAGDVAGSKCVDECVSRSN